LQIDEQPVELEVVFSNSLDEVWNAITEPDQMRQWFFAEMEDFVPEPGFETSFTIEHDEREFPHRWKVVGVKPKSEMEVEWRYDGFAGAAKLTWFVSEDGGTTSLRIRHTALESFPADDPVFSRESCVAGWEFLLEESLAEFLAGEEEE